MDILKEIEEHLQAGKRILAIIISKSGTTTETLMNAAFLTDLMRRYIVAYHTCMVVITAPNSPMASIAEQNNYHMLAVEPAISGRFSVFSAVLGNMGFK